MVFDRERHLRQLDDDMAHGRVDEGIIPLISAINERDGYVTTSSCAGRIQLIAVPVLGDKSHSMVLGKWHSPVSDDVISEAAGGWDGKGLLHLQMQSMIVHVRCRDLKLAIALRNMADGCGLKYSTIRSIRLDRDDDPQDIIVELQGTERLDVPLGRDQLMVSCEYLAYLSERANDALQRNQEKRQALEQTLKHTPSSQKGDKQVQNF